MDENDFPIDKIVKRLEIIRNFILIEDAHEIDSFINKLTEYQFNSDIKYIIEAMQNKEYGLGIKLIQDFINKSQQIVLWNDPEIVGLKLEIKQLQELVNEADNEKIEIEKLLSDFQYRHSMELGEIILKILNLRKERFKNDEGKSKEAEEDFNQFNEQFELEKEKNQYNLSENEKKELKKSFRKASTLCHPDKVNEEQRDKAEKLFIELKEAYDKQDLQKVNQVLSELEKGNFFNLDKVDDIVEKETLKAKIESLKKKLNQLETEIDTIKTSETFKEIISIDDWDTYFENTKIKLKEELNRLSQEIKD